jgi:hypothetical protein
VSEVQNIRDARLLIGFQLVRLYNDSVFEMRHKHDPIFTILDVETVVTYPAFFQGGRGYFDEVWGQAETGAIGQQDILKVMAPYPEGLTYSELAQQCNATQQAIDTLIRHDVIKENAGRKANRCRIIPSLGFAVSEFNPPNKNANSGG